MNSLKATPRKGHNFHFGLNWERAGKKKGRALRLVSLFIVDIGFNGENFTMKAANMIAMRICLPVNFFRSVVSESDTKKKKCRSVNR